MAPDCSRQACDRLRRERRLHGQTLSHPGIESRARRGGARGRVGCSAELVIAVRPRTGSYLHADLIFGILVGLAALAVLLFSPWIFAPVWFLIDPLLIGAAGRARRLPERDGCGGRSPRSRGAGSGSRPRPGPPSWSGASTARPGGPASSSTSRSWSGRRPSWSTSGSRPSPPRTAGSAAVGGDRAGGPRQGRRRRGGGADPRPRPPAGARPGPRRERRRRAAERGVLTVKLCSSGSAVSSPGWRFLALLLEPADGVRPGGRRRELLRAGAAAAAGEAATAASSTC